MASSINKKKSLLLVIFSGKVKSVDLDFWHLAKMADEDFSFKRLGQKISQLRKIRRLSQEVLSFESGLDRTYICRIENGQANPTIKTIRKIALALKTKVIVLFD
ncbi:MAG: helix-turn-helix domain-containing protein [Patescibacteria group bacterium]|nr:helix-turn-helix domain-containing protein [Patescibacteria group bacterium]